MRSLLLLALALRLALPLWGDAPVYSADTIFNAASNQPGAVAPNTIAILTGENLSQATAVFMLDNSGLLPIVLPGTGVEIVIGSLPVNPLYVSPTQITFLVPPNLPAGTFNLVLTIEGLDGPTIQIQLAETAPALFQIDSQNAMAVGADGLLITPDAPAMPGDSIVLYATGLGPTAPRVVYRQLPMQAATLSDIADFTVLLDGVAVDLSAIAYAGIAPGFAGMYEVDLTLPSATGANPQIQIGFPDSLSPAGVTLPVQTTAPQPQSAKPRRATPLPAKPVAAKQLPAQPVPAQPVPAQQPVPARP
ncbi:MAG TPA: hypothetical protein VEV17_03490 [Bryobacteraceae bacterium]|nr:hypothetical protein [Bryobacteraceae bacterium]